MRQDAASPASCVQEGCAPLISYSMREKVGSFQRAPIWEAMPDGESTPLQAEAILVSASTPAGLSGRPGDTHLPIILPASGSSLNLTTTIYPFSFLSFVSFTDIQSAYVPNLVLSPFFLSNKTSHTLCTRHTSLSYSHGHCPLSSPRAFA